MPLKPEPISNALDAGRLNIALARSASSLSNTGSPQPAGTPRAMPSTMPPTVSPARRIFSMSRIIFSAAVWSGQRTMFDSMSLSFTRSGFTSRDEALNLFDVGQDLDAVTFA